MTKGAGQRDARWGISLVGFCSLFVLPAFVSYFLSILAIILRFFV